jgi:hypothetical protein
MSEPSNMTDAHLDALMDVLPDEMSEAELCALTLTIYSAFIGDPAVVVPSLVSAIYTYAGATGTSKQEVSRYLRAVGWDQRDNDETTH